MAIVKLNIACGLDLIEECEQYELYGAIKSGKKKSDLPSLSKDQIISKIGMNRFALCSIDQRCKNNSSGELYSLKSIETDFTPKRHT